MADQLWTERRPADADDEEILELALWTGDLPVVHLGREVLDRGEGRRDFAADRRIGRELWRAQPVVPDHALLVGIRDGARFELRHRLERPLYPRLHGGEKIVRKRHPRNIERNAEVGVVI